MRLVRDMIHWRIFIFINYIKLNRLPYKEVYYSTRLNLRTNYSLITTPVLYTLLLASW